MIKLPMRISKKKAYVQVIKIKNIYIYENTFEKV